MNVYEVEVKSLLGEAERAEELKRKLHLADPNVKHLSSHKQLNHYFIGGDLTKLAKSFAGVLSAENHEKLEDIISKGSDFSVRTRLADGTLLFVVKASVDEGTSANSVSRMEFEAKIADTELKELDHLLETAGFAYQAKWSREREEYLCRGINVCLDKNAGYGHLAEFEKIVKSEDAVPLAREEIRDFMRELEIEELKQDRLERMFEHYNRHWRDYYGTEKVFTVL